MPEASGRESTPERTPLTAGAKVTETLHAAPGASMFPHVLEAMAKSPVIVGGLSVALSVPPLLTVTVCAAEVLPTPVCPKFNAPGASVTIGDPTPAPVSTTGWVPLASETVRVPVRVPVARGVKSTETVQEAPASSVLAQLFAAMKKSPVMVAAESAMAAVPLLVTVTPCAAEVLLTATVPKDKDTGLTATLGVPCPAPVSRTMCVVVCRVSGSET